MEIYLKLALINQLIINTEFAMEKYLDCTGLQCPQPVIRCREIVRAEEPDIINVIVDNLAAVENVGRFLNSNGYEASTAKTGDNQWKIRATRKGDLPGTKKASEEDEGKTLILITTETLGRGDDELGAKLMATFLGSLPELGHNLWRIILLNGGVKLAANPGPCLENLKSLAASGTSILVCGTCLMHYGLMEQKQVGETTNMMDVMTSISLANKVVRP